MQPWNPEGAHQQHYSVYRNVQSIRIDISVDANPTLTTTRESKKGRYPAQNAFSGTLIPAPVKPRYERLGGFRLGTQRSAAKHSNGIVRRRNCLHRGLQSVEIYVSKGSNVSPKKGGHCPVASAPPPYVAMSNYIYLTSGRFIYVGISEPAEDSRRTHQTCIKTCHTSEPYASTRFITYDTSN